MKNSTNASMQSSASPLKLPLLPPKLENVNQSLPRSESTHMNGQSQSQSQSPNSLNQSQSQRKPTGTTGRSASVDKKLAAEDLKFGKLETDVKELLGSAVGVVMLV